MYTDIFIVRRDCVFRNLRIFPFLEKAVFFLFSSRKDAHLFVFVMQKRYGNVVFSEYGNFRKSTKISSFRIFSRFFSMRKERILCSGTYVICDLKGEKTVGTFYEKELQKTNQKEFRVEKVIKRKGDKLYVKWIGYDSSFNS